MKMDKNWNNSKLALWVVAFLCIPYLGNIGGMVFSSVGKYYYVVLGVVCTGDMVYNLWKRNWDVRGFLNYGRNKIVIPVLVVLVLLVAISLLLGNTFDNVAFGILLLFFYFYYAQLYVTDVFLEQIGKGATVLLYVEGFLTMIADTRLEYFNPNSYAFFATVMFMFSCLYVCKGERSRQKTTVFCLNAIMAFALCYLVYKSETQLLSLVLFIMLVLAGRWMTERTKLYRLFVLTVFAFVILLPLVTCLLIEMNVLTTDFLSMRGMRWMDATADLRAAGLLRVSNSDVGPHNGVLDICLKYGVLASIGGLVVLFCTIASKSTAVKSDRMNRLLFYIVITLVFMNSVESFMVGLTDGYVMLIALAMLSSRSEKYYFF